MTLQGQDLHEYRAGWRGWLYAMAKAEKRGMELLTLTLQDNEIGGTVISDHDPVWLAQKVEFYARESELDGVVVLEHGKRGNRRIHAHALVASTLRSGQLVAKWKEQMGFAVRHDVSDLLGAVYYITKSFGPDSLFAVCGTWREEWRTRDIAPTVGLVETTVAELARRDEEAALTGATAAEGGTTNAQLRMGIPHTGGMAAR